MTISAHSFPIKVKVVMLWICDFYSAVKSIVCMKSNDDMKVSTLAQVE